MENVFFYHFNLLTLKLKVEEYELEIVMKKEEGYYVTI